FGARQCHDAETIIDTGPAAQIEHVVGRATGQRELTSATVQRTDPTGRDVVRDAEVEPLHRLNSYNVLGGAHQLEADHRTVVRQCREGDPRGRGGATCPPFGKRHPSTFVDGADGDEATAKGRDRVVTQRS